MRDISYHILDIVQNSIHAGATVIRTEIAEDSLKGKMTLKISDNGHGMNPDFTERATDPFCTTSLTKKVGLGLPLLKQNTEKTGGVFRIESAANMGTTVTASFNSEHIDMLPMGALSLTFKTLLAAYPEIGFIYMHRKNDIGFELDTAEIKEYLGDVPMNTHEVLEYVSTFIRDNLKALTI